MVVERTTSATTSALSDMSNFASMSVVTTTTTASTSKTQQTVSPLESDVPVRDTANMEEVEMDMEDDDQSVQYDQSTINQTRFMNQIDMTMLPVRSSEEHLASSQSSSSSSSSGDSENSNDSESGNTATGITNSMVTTNLTQDVSMDPLPSKGGQNLRPSPLCMLNNVTHSIVVEVSRHASHLLGESSTTQPLGEITQSVPKRTSADATYVLAEKTMDEPTGLINDNHHDEDEAMDQPTGTFGIISDKNRRLQNETLSRTTNVI